MIKPILIYGDPALETLCVPVTEFGTKELEQLSEDLKDTCVAANGLGLAAPQIGVLQRVFVVRRAETYVTLVNPQIRQQDGIQDGEEGCLSIPGWKGYMRRAETVVVDALDIYGKDLRIVGTGRLAAALSHETDHLDGRLFIHYLGAKHCALAKAHVERYAARVKKNADIALSSAQRIYPSHTKDVSETESIEVYDKEPLGDPASE